ncbi:M23 family metallopeptidase [Pseudanabaena galeata]|uniref:M23 family metallopeptidase n=1 Tax=Pseudanabaena galeata TaxID=1112103 RepID=UPI0024785C26|nr:M23 family metallopeptidase [Pseudanabaena galeata]WGS74148.1 M23 family metallopeptidase [Pseudanabaena galeata CCNP1313]
MKIHLRFRLAVFVISLSSTCVTPVLAQVCLKEYPHPNLEDHKEEYSPTQRVASVRGDRDLTLAWALPAEFTEIHPFIGKDYNLAEHEGLDFIHSSPLITQVSVRSASDGTVVYIRRDCPQSDAFAPNSLQRDCGSDWGNHIVIRHPNGLFTRYAHLYPNSIQVKVGQKITRGQELGYMGNSGRSDIRHLHFELGVAVKIDPCGSAQSFHYVYNPATYLQWENLKNSQDLNYE